MTLNCKGVLIDLTSPRVMGILNLTPDSFYDGGIHSDEKKVLNLAEKMLDDGATFIDLGAYSSRPGAAHIPEAEELKRILPIVDLLLGRFPEILLSIDTFRSLVAQKCLEHGAAMVNDISAGKLDENMLPTVANFQVPYIMMHMKGNPQTMQQHTEYDNLLGDILYYFSERLAIARKLKINDIIIDPGFGFAKTLTQNYALLRNLERLQTLEVPILAGLSRKSMIFKTLNSNAANALNGTTALNMFALGKGANLLRVHDVKEAMECVRLYNQLA